MINIYLDNILYYNITIKNNFFKKLLKNKNNALEILNLLIIKNNIRKCEIIL